MTERRSARRGIERFSSGWATWRWISGVSSKQKQWFLGTLSRRGGYEAWMAYLEKSLRNPEFLSKFATSDPWEKSRLVGTKISEICVSFRRLTSEEREELAREGEVELRTGLELMSKDKKMIEELIALVDAPTR